MPDLHLMVVPCLPTQSLRRGGCQGRLLLASPPTIYITSSTLTFAGLNKYCVHALPVTLVLWYAISRVLMYACR